MDRFKSLSSTQFVWVWMFAILDVYEDLCRDVVLRPCFEWISGGMEING